MNRMDTKAANETYAVGRVSGTEKSLKNRFNPSSDQLYHPCRIQVGLRARNHSFARTCPHAPERIQIEASCPQHSLPIDIQQKSHFRLLLANRHSRFPTSRLTLSSCQTPLIFLHVMPKWLLTSMEIFSDDQFFWLMDLKPHACERRWNPSQVGKHDDRLPNHPTEFWNLASVSPRCLSLVSPVGLTSRRQCLFTQKENRANFMELFSSPNGITENELR